ncbi:hypothetical protein, partial [Corallococcus exiguus]
ASIGMGVAVGLTQGWLLRREVHGAAVWVAACAVGYGMAGPAADWKTNALRAAVDVGATWRLSSIVITAQAMTWGALALCTAIGGAFILSSLRTQVLTATGSRMPGALGQFAVLGLALPLMVALEAREKSPPPRELSEGCVLPVVPAPIREPAKRVVPSTPGEVLSPGCVGAVCRNVGLPTSPPPAAGIVTEPRPRPAPVLHDEHLRTLFREEQKRMPSPTRRWNNPASGDAPLPAGATGRSSNSVAP